MAPVPLGACRLAPGLLVALGLVLVPLGARGSVPGPLVAHRSVPGPLVAHGLVSVPLRTRGPWEPHPQPLPWLSSPSAGV